MLWNAAILAAPKKHPGPCDLVPATDDAVRIASLANRRTRKKR
jgi:hypothetical protein